MGIDSDDLLVGLDPNFALILGVGLAIVLANQAPSLLAVLGGLVFFGWVLVQLGVFADDADDATESDGPLEALQTRYARGEIDEVEFERRLDRIIESSDAVDRRDGSTASSQERDRLETGRGREDAEVRSVTDRS